MATLTGAGKVALGVETGALYCADDEMLKRIKKASSDSFEAVWHMPIVDEHREAMKGKYSDLNNLGYSRFGGSCTAAAFLERFIDKDVKWAHLDMSGPAKADSTKPPICSD